MKQLYEGTFEYGWSHKGVKGWGANWHRHARNIALEQIRKKIATMVNLKELETLAKKDLKQSLIGKGSKGKTGDSISISLSKDKSKEDQVRWLNENNYLIDIKNVQIIAGTDYTKSTDERPLRGRTFMASATMQVDLRIYGK